MIDNNYPLQEGDKVFYTPVYNMDVPFVSEPDEELTGTFVQWRHDIGDYEGHTYVRVLWDKSSLYWNIPLSELTLIEKKKLNAPKIIRYEEGII